ncbi:MAG: aminotransferase class V-fold PLP-dependent enzyme [Candidatus Omnitrophota bacterium]
MGFDCNQLRKDFPSLESVSKGKKPVYFDNACVTLRPRQVVEAMNEYYMVHPSCHKRSVHKFGLKTTSAYEQAKKSVQRFINAKSADEIVFTKNATESINLVANGINFLKGEVVLTSSLEHNSNFLPWQMIGRKKETVLRIFGLTEDLKFDQERFVALLKEGAKLVSIVHTSHITGYTFPIEDIIRLSHEHGALVLVDGAQSIAHHSIDVQKLDADFFAFSFHKMLGPSGMGCLYAKKKHLDNLEPLYIGGETVDDVSANSFVLSKVPDRFEAGLQNYAGASGVTAAIEYLTKTGLKEIRAHVSMLNRLMTDTIKSWPKVRIIGPQDPDLRSGIINFYVEGMDSGELSIILDQTENIMTRSGVHCCHAGYKRHRLTPSLRVSLYAYNTEEEVRLFIETLRKIIQFF